MQEQGFVRKLLTTRFGIPVLGAVIVLLALVISSALAVEENDIVELDGNVVDGGDAGLDWNSIFTATGGVENLVPGEIARFFGKDFVEGASGPDPSYHEPSNKDDQAILASGGASVWGCGSVANATDKNDFLNGYAVGVDVGGDLVVYGGGERHSNDGTAFIGVWIFQNDVECDLGLSKFVNADDPTLPGKTNGDVLIIINFSKGGAPGAINMTAFTWSPGADDDDAGTLTPAAALPNAKCSFLPETADLCAEVNFTAEVNPDWPSEDKTGGNIDVAGFFEFGVNVSEVLGENAPNCFGSIMFETRSSDSVEATLKDFVLGDFDTCGSVTIIKDTVPDGTQVFAYTSDLDGGGGTCTTDPTANAFSLVNDSAAPDASAIENCIDVTAGSYFVQETLGVAGYVLKNIVCSGDTGIIIGDGAGPNPQDGDFDAGDFRVEIDLDPGEDVVCTFTNEKLGKVTVIKDAIPNDVQDFTYSDTIPAPCAIGPLDDDGETAISPDRTVCSNVLAGSYTVTETSIPAGWYLKLISCTVDVAGVSPGTGFTITGAVAPPPITNGFEAGDTTVNITLTAGGEITCTYTNEKLGKVTVIKDAIPDDVQNFTYSDTIPAPCAIGPLDDDGETAILSDRTVCSNVLAGSYTVIETSIPAGWYLKLISCTVDVAGVSPGTSFTITGAVAPPPITNGFEAGDTTVNITLTAGGEITCTYTNEKLARIIVDKVTVPDPDLSDTSFAFDAGGTGYSDFNLTNDDAANDTGFTLVAGAYSVREFPIPAGWSLTGISCTVDVAGASPGTSFIIDDFAGVNPNDTDFDANDDRVLFTMTAGGQVSCTFTDTSLFKLIILTCDTTSETLIVSSVDPTSGANSFGTIGATPTIGTPPALSGKTAAELHAYLCGLGGASFDNLITGVYGTDTTIPAP